MPCAHVTAPATIPSATGPTQDRISRQTGRPESSRRAFQGRSLAAQLNLIGSLRGLPSDFLFQSLQIFLRNLIHVVVQGGDYTRSEGSQQPVDESFHDTTFDLVLGMKAIDVSGPASADSLVSSQDAFLVQPIQRRTDCGVRESACGMKILSDLACRSISQPYDCPENRCF